MNNTKQILINDIINISLQAGVLVLENGGETYRAEETCTKIAKSLGAHDASCFVTPTVIIITITAKNHKIITATKRIKNINVNLQKISQINKLALKLESQGTNINILQIGKELEQIKNAPNHRKFMLILMAGLSAFFFSFMFGGSVKESVTAFFIGMILRIELIILNRFNLNSFILSIINGAIISILCALVILLGLVPATITVMTAVLMQVVPGMAIVNAIRDLIAGDLIAGTARVMDAFMIAAGLSVGSVCGVYLISHVLA